jgi:hypothetical protein
MSDAVSRKRQARSKAKPEAASGAKRTAAARASTRKRESRAPERSGYTVTLRYLDGEKTRELAIATNDREFYPIAQKWRYVVANRQRITRTTRGALSEDVFNVLLAVSRLDPFDLEAHVRAMARGGIVEVKIPFERESLGWAARVFPWENVIGLVTKPYRAESAQLTVVRHLSCSREKAERREPTKALVVRSGPGELATLFDLENESSVVSEILGAMLSSERVRTLHEPDLASLRACVQADSPGVIHLVGVDPLALTAYNLAGVAAEHQDGFVLRGAQPGEYHCALPDELALAANAGSEPPILVAISACFSAPRVAALMVASGVQHAVGFQDSVTDAESLLFFNVLYRTWSQTRSIRAAFEAARARLMQQVSTPGGSGVVLWSRESLLVPPTVVPAAQKEALEVRLRAATVDDLRLTIKTGPETSSPVGRRREPSLNYSLLHNDRSPFTTFFIDKPYPGPLPPLHVEVALEIGNEACGCRFSEQLSEAATPIELAGKIRLPLVAALLRQCTESLRTNLYIKVECGDRLLCERSERITLLPADEWRDDGEDHRWLPSFVQPRDPAVLRIVNAAQRYLCTLLDDCTARFDGYQRLAADGSNAADVVDPQVQAMWAALQHDIPLSYINPPPSYTSMSQRLRGPTEILRGGAATCIDLALLFASCLEYVGIYPVIFLITGHAFPGFWRSDAAWLRMRQFRFKEGPADGAPSPGATADRHDAPRGQTEAWMFEGIDNLPELLRYLQAGSLVPFESTLVTSKGGFFAAIEAGAASLHPETFDAMVDVQSARGEAVTPLPLVDTRS